MNHINFTYNTKNLPPLVAGTENIFVYPKKGVDVAVCFAPAPAVIARPASWGGGLNQTLEIPRGEAHIAQDGEGDSYPNLEFAKFYELGKELKAADDARAKFLSDFWRDQGGYTVKTFLATKTRPAITVGQVEGITGTFVNHEGETQLDQENGGYILRSPDDPDVMWYVTNLVLSKKYEPIKSS
jgi:hypothetical protein